MNSYEQRSNNTRNKKSTKNWSCADPYIDRRTSRSNFDPYDLLCLAIIKQAVKDTDNEKSGAYQFWTSDWYDMLTLNLPQFANIGEKIRDQAVANHRAGRRAGLAGLDSDFYDI